MSIDVSGISAQTPALAPLRCDPSATDAELTVAAQGGSEEAFGELYRRYQSPIFNYLYRLTGHAATAQDLTSDTFAKAWLYLPATDARTPRYFRGWLYRVAQNIYYDHWRHNQVVHWHPWTAYTATFHPSHVADNRDQPYHQAERAELETEVRAVLALLPARWREALVLREYGDLSYNEIAARQGVTRASAKSVLFRARNEFRRLWQARQDRQAREYPDAL